MKALQTRSPIHLYYNNSTIDKVDVSIFLSDDFTSFDTTTSPAYQLTSDAINDEVIFEISELLRSANQYEFSKDFYSKRDTAIYVLCKSDLLDSNGDLIESRYNYFKVRDGYVERLDQTQILNNNTTPQINTWSNNVNADILTQKQLDPFGGSDAFLVRDFTQGLGVTLSNQLDVDSIHTLSVYAKYDNVTTEISLGISASVNATFNLQSGIVTNVTSGILAYDVVEFSNDWLRLSIVVKMGVNNRIRISTPTPQQDEQFLIFNPIVLKGDYINQTASDLVLQDNFNIYNSADITPKIALERKESQVYSYDNFNLKDDFASDNTLTSISYTATEEDVSLRDLNDVVTTQGIKVIEICEPKYTPIKISFINRFGVIQDVVFFKKRVDSYSTSEEDYKSNIITNGEVYPHLGQRRIYNKKAKASLKISSGFYPEEFNTVFKQLLYSEMYWIDDEPAILTDSSWTEKTRVNDKLINYDFDFDFANDDINSIR